MKPILADFTSKVQSFNSIREDWKHDDLCRKCGECCRLKLRIDEKVVALPFFCPALDAETRKCRIYYNRFEVLPRLVGRQCQTARQARENGDLPLVCAYVDAATYDGWRFSAQNGVDAARLAAIEAQNKEERIKISAYLDSQR